MRLMLKRKKRCYVGLFLSCGFILTLIIGVLYKTNLNFENLTDNGESSGNLLRKDMTTQDIFEFLLEKYDTMIQNGEIDIENFTSTTSQNILRGVKFINSAQNESITITQEYITNPTLQMAYINCENTSTHHSVFTQDVIMGYSLEFVKTAYKVEYEQWEGEKQIAYAFFGFVFRIKFDVQFPIRLIVVYPNELGSENEFEVRLNAITRPAFSEIPIYLQIKVNAGIKLEGEYGEYSLMIELPAGFDYYTPLSATLPIWVNIDCSLRFLYVASVYWPEPYRSMADYIYQNLVNAISHFYGKIGVFSIRAKATAYGDDVDIEGQPSKELIWYEDWDSVYFTVNVRQGSKIRVDITDFQVELRDSYFALGLDLDWRPLLEAIPFFGDKWSFLMWNFTIATSEELTYQSNPDTISVVLGDRPLPSLGVNLHSMSPPQSVLPSEYVIYTFTIENLGNSYDTYDLSISGIDPSWVIMPSKISLNEGESRTISLIITPPRQYSAIAGWYDFTIRATSQEDPSIFATLNSSVQILPFYDLEVLRISQIETNGILTLAPGESASISLNITNLGNTPEEFTIELDSLLDESWFSWPSSVQLDPGQYIIIPVTVQIPSDFSRDADYYGLILTVNSTSSPIIYAYDRGMLNITVPARKIQISIQPTYVEVEPGSKISYNLSIENQGSLLENLAVKVSGLNASWWWLTEDNFVLLPNHAKNISLFVEPPRHYSVEPKNYTLNVTVFSIENPTLRSSAFTILRVLTFREIKLILIPEHSFSFPDYSIQFQFSLQNLGNSLETYYLTLHLFDFDDFYRAIPTSLPEEWVSLKPDYVTLGPAERIIGNITMNIPQSWMGMENATYLFVLNVSTFLDPSWFHEIDGTLTIIPTPLSMMGYIQYEISTLINILNQTDGICFTNQLIPKLERAHQLLECAKSAYLEENIPKTVVLELITQIQVEWAEIGIFLGDLFNCINDTFTQYLLDYVNQIQDDLFILMGATIGGWKAGELADIMIILNHLIWNNTIALELAPAIMVNIPLKAALHSLELAIFFLSCNLTTHFEQTVSIASSQIDLAITTTNCLVHLHWIEEDYGDKLVNQLIELNCRIKALL